MHKIVYLRHDKALGLPTSRRLGVLHADMLANVPEDVAIYTFRKLHGLSPHQTPTRLTAVTRLAPIAPRIALWGMNDDSPLAGILIWDLAHRLPIGGDIFVFGDQMAHKHWLDRDYYLQAFERLPTPQGFRWRKKEACRAERGGLEAWTFAVPVGPEDATILNKCVERLLALPLAEKEILLCGRPAANFRYFDQVRIVGEHITAPPVRICTKKNLLVQEARHENICLLHERVHLPLDFGDAVRRFGDAFPLTGFHSIYFRDRWNCIPQRYSDYNTIVNLVGQRDEGLTRGNGARLAHLFAPSIDAFCGIERGYFAYANPLRYNEFHYLTGSLYLTKKSLWQFAPQDENLHWLEFEDVEHGLRAAALGIPSRINPHAITQSLVSRPVMAFFGNYRVETARGNVPQVRSPLILMPLPRKPILKKTEAQAAADFALFVQRWCAPQTVTVSPSAYAQDRRMRTRGIVEALRALNLPRSRTHITALCRDFEKLVLGDQVPFFLLRRLEDELMSPRSDPLERLLKHSLEYRNQVAESRRAFVRSWQDYFVSSRGLAALGTVSSVLQLILKERTTWALGSRLALLRRFRMIWNSTPFASQSTYGRDAP